LLGQSIHHDATDIDIQNRTSTDILILMKLTVAVFTRLRTLEQKMLDEHTQRRQTGEIYVLKRVQNAQSQRTLKDICEQRKLISGFIQKTLNTHVGIQKTLNTHVGIQKRVEVKAPFSFLKLTQ
jgi:hypothetical protein